MSGIICFPEIGVERAPEFFGCANSLRHDGVVNRKQARPLPRDQLASRDRPDAVHAVEQVPKLPSRPRLVDEFGINFYEIQGSWDLAQEIANLPAVGSQDSECGTRRDLD